MEAVLEDCYVLVSNVRASFQNDVLPVMTRVLESKETTKLLLIAADVEEEALATMVVNKMRGSMQICAIRAPGFGDRRRDFLEDIALLTGATVIHEEMGVALKSVTVKPYLGRVKKVIITQNTTTLITEQTEERKTAIAQRIERLRTELAAADKGYDKEKTRERLAKMTGGVAVIRVGAATETELREKKFRVEDAMYATRAAVSDGIVAGGGMALLRASKELQSQPFIAGWTESVRAGWRLLQTALREPFRCIIENGGGKPDLLAEKLLDMPVEMGYDAAKEEIVDMHASGVVDPAKVVREELTNAASIAALLLTTEAVVTEVPEPESSGLTSRQEQIAKGAFQRLKRKGR